MMGPESPIIPVPSYYLAHYSHSEDKLHQSTSLSLLSSIIATSEVRPVCVNVVADIMRVTEGPEAHLGNTFNVALLPPSKPNGATALGAASVYLALIGGEMPPRGPPGRWGAGREQSSISWPIRNHTDRDTEGRPRALRDTTTRTDFSPSSDLPEFLHFTH
ncbi:hypothetical protein EYF80_017380 [Liparis tanakae]|uniref:Uncharacterized protein n=1 Tax=Liparis tanakae TaxID=230148 RepID=A0A4Z2I578_9TELE|nr:hypothetical protein EYF80_017380 [Liparis tanakae]